MSKKQTAVEWLEEIYLTTGIDRNVHFNQAKLMECEQMIQETQKPQLNIPVVRLSCDNCKYLMIKQPTFDQPYTECWCERGCFDAYSGGNELEEETNCTFFNYA